MEILKRIEGIFGQIQSTSKESLKGALEELDVQYEELVPYLKDPKGKPYYRKLLYQDENVEMLVMNWSDIECAPHDHGDSYGWIQVMNGISRNTVYEVKGDELPVELFSEYKKSGRLFFAPKKGVHKMTDPAKSDLVTLHLYSPPITGMVVYDIETCAACVVSDDCGAWWPEDIKQKIREYKLQKSAQS
ncbi:cysteine dioxygenase [Pseudalkalibacillus berkeleyi]|uniref:Cysteine dioxygenase family protein n=1 Tax=Pseudalkalibacillus berkeleyi TaxID=1069813 RepID=A0ABS9H4I1_9BACL|nr:cysteine dioxygenase family protein [Pseudalkalibacillus berkeleyi]MCF6138986.1 cysteine dioxygenase family protein [Pseudalkalibacillus berkeleyi]